MQWLTPPLAIPIPLSLRESRLDFSHHYFKLQVLGSSSGSIDVTSRGVLTAIFATLYGGLCGSINLGGHSDTLKVKGKENISVYNAVLNRDTPQQEVASSERNFCDNAELTCIKLNSKHDYVHLPETKKKVYEDYGPDSLEGGIRSIKLSYKDFSGFGGFVAI
ncbi:hypothetical protein BDQ17DRAFT_1334508 [Cyathus striatus]|nr:hypothetical protein BDQ17DRAFT_1334508 [Cyathus striatus]